MPVKKAFWPPWFEPRLPTVEECTLPSVIAGRAARDMHGTLLVLDDGGVWSNRQALDRVIETAKRLRKSGVGTGDRVLLWLPNGPDLLRYLLAAWSIGATPMPINSALRGSPLSHAVGLADAKAMVVYPGLLPRLDVLGAEQLAGLTAIVVTGTQPPEGDEFALRAQAEATIPVEGIELEQHLCQPWEIAAIIFSSGTTGVPKGVMVPFVQLWSLGQAFYGYLGPQDRMLLMYPLFHVAGLGALFGALSCGATLALTESFRAGDFLEVVRRTGATSTPGLGRTLVDAVNKSLQRSPDLSNSLRIINVQSVNPAVREFSSKLQCDVVPSYSMTETSGICVGVPGQAKDGSIGRPRSGLEVRLVDEHDLPVPRGQAGEIIVRAELPWVLNAGYFRNPQATAEAWRNGWFHTGDIAREDEDGDLYFLDRSRDVIRRRSENISSLEIEAEARQHPQVQDAAAIGVETQEGEEVLLVIAPIAGATIDPADLLRFLIARLPHFMVPRFVRVVPELPKTQTNRVQKAELRREGLTAHCWDRESAGIRVRRERL
jgi:crotonobetaine/carnitine-CoA ligase